jgi:hypothetical protein
MTTYNLIRRVRAHLPMLGLVASFAAISTTAQAQLLDSYDGSTLTAGTNVSTWTDTVGGQNATAGSATEFNNLTQQFYTVNAGGVPTADNTNSVFNGHTYVDFGYQSGLATASGLFSGSGARSVAAVYNTPTGNSDLFTNPIAGQVGPGVAGEWFMLQARNAPAGSPYLAGFAADTGTGTVPVANQLTFALGTYDGTTETLYWAFGVNGAVQSDSAPYSLNTASSPFQFGYDSGGEASLGNMQIGTVQVFGNAMNLTQATAAIHALQLEYSPAEVPEPSTWALMLGGVVALVLIQRARRSSV